jgi:lactoylglutathione lyase
MRVKINYQCLACKDHAHKYLADKMDFPVYYGKNFDALWDILTSIHKETHIIIYNVDRKLEYAEKILDLLEEVSEFNKNLTVEILREEGSKMNLAWITLHVNDMEESVKFYTEVVGLEVSRRFKATSDMEIAFLGNGETKVELIYRDSQKPCNYGDSLSIGFTVDSLKDHICFLEESGIVNLEGPYSPNDEISYIFITDPNGVRIQFAETK